MKQFDSLYNKIISQQKASMISVYQIYTLSMKLSKNGEIPFNKETSVKEVIDNNLQIHMDRVPDNFLNLSQSVISYWARFQKKGPAYLNTYLALSKHQVTPESDYDMIKVEDKDVIRLIQGVWLFLNNRYKIRQGNLQKAKAVNFDQNFQTGKDLQNYTVTFYSIIENERIHGFKFSIKAKDDNGTIFYLYNNGYKQGQEFIELNRAYRNNCVPDNLKINFSGKIKQATNTYNTVEVSFLTINNFDEILNLTENTKPAFNPDDIINLPKSVPGYIRTYDMNGKSITMSKEDLSVMEENIIDGSNILNLNIPQPNAPVDKITKFIDTITWTNQELKNTITTMQLVVIIKYFDLL